MNYKIIKTFFLFIFLVSFIFGDTVKIINKKDNFVSDIQTLDRLQGTFISIIDISKILAKRDPYINSERKKMVLYIGDNRIKVSSGSSYILSLIHI